MTNASNMIPCISILIITLSLGGFATTVPRVVSIPFSKTNASTRLRKRDTFPVTLDNYLPDYEFFATASVGTPPQLVSLVLDTGSSDTWMFAPNTCHLHYFGPCLGGSFDPSKSSTLKDLPDLGRFQILYADSEKDTGIYISDDFAIGGKTISGLTMGLVNKSNHIANSGVIGLGLETNEAGKKKPLHPYPNLPDALVQQGLISSKSYSLYLDDYEERTGTVLFGGYDTEKFSGELTMLPIQKDPLSGIRSTFTISLTEFGISFQGKMSSFTADGFPYPVLLDSGTALIYLPTILFEPFRKLFKLHCSYGSCLVDCDIKKFLGEGTFDFSFGDTVKISIPVEEMATPLYGPHSGHIDRSLCGFNIVPQPPIFGVILGQPFLRSAYVLYDLDNLFIGLAQAKSGVNKSNIVEYTGISKAKSITTDFTEPMALETPVTSISYSFISTHFLPSAPLVRPTYITPIPSAFRYVPLPSGKFPAVVPNLLTSVSITPHATGIGHGHGEGSGNEGPSGGSRAGGGNPATTSGIHNRAFPMAFPVLTGTLTATVILMALLL